MEAATKNWYGDTQERIQNYETKFPEVLQGPKKILVLSLLNGSSLKSREHHSPHTRYSLVQLCIKLGNPSSCEVQIVESLKCLDSLSLASGLPDGITSGAFTKKFPSHPDKNKQQSLEHPQGLGTQSLWNFQMSGVREEQGAGKQVQTIHTSP